MLNWVLIVLMFSTAGSGMTSIRVSSKESCENIAKQLPKFMGRNYNYLCIEDKQ